jgi:hypothetical protein
MVTVAMIATDSAVAAEWMTGLLATAGLEEGEFRRRALA